MIDPRDPLAGLDPYPRELVDALGSDQERADLLEEIVSTPGPAQSTPARTRVLLSLGIAAAIAIIGGGWLLASSNGGGDDTPVAAASATTTATSTPTTASTAAATPTVATKTHRCREFLSRHGQVRDALEQLQGGRLGTKAKHERLYLRVDKHGRQVVVVVGPGCKIRGLRSLNATRQH